MSVTYTEGGIGRKACTCGVFVPARTSKCPKCGRIFVSRLAEHRARESEEARVRAELAKERAAEEVEAPKKSIRGATSDGRPVLLVPSGRCPVALEGTDLATVQMWVAACCEKETTFAIGRTCAAQWARQFYSIGSDEYKTVVGHLSNCRHLVEEEVMPAISPGAIQKVAPKFESQP